ncbi:MAG: 4Fe-4S dicluster domain-containing protein [Archaeoglobi archaeon]|nr:4Fe-4S dicluster domain-containing protein [Candidatus Mnemosynella sp.]
MGRIIIKPEVCAGCHLCEIWCIVAHSGSKDPIKAFLYDSNRSHPRVLVEEKLPETLAIQCNHCDEPECMVACISGAIYRDENGKVVHDSEKCGRCYSCVMACPYGAVILSETGEVVKCDLCESLELPFCVMFCPNDALEYVDEEEL